MTSECILLDSGAHGLCPHVVLQQTALNCANTETNRKVEHRVDRLAGGVCVPMTRPGNLSNVPLAHL